MSTQEARGATTNGRPASKAATSGLEGIVVAQTALSDVDGQQGRLTIRGYELEELAGRATFEEVAYLLWHGKLPNRGELRTLEE